MKEELTIEDVSMYLPWNVNMIFTKSGDVRELTGVFMECEELRFCFGVINRGQDLWKYKLALRPMSDLHKTDIDVQGHEGHFHYLEEKYLNHDEDIIHLKRVANEDERWSYSLPWYIMNHLFEYHFDVFGLIGRGLAVNLNDLKL